MHINTIDVLTLGWFTHHKCEEIHYNNVTADSRKVTHGSVFFAFDGLQFPGKQFIPEVLDKNASAVFIDSKYEQELKDVVSARDIPVFYSPDFSQIAGETISLLYNRPSAQLNCIGITGTNGKTTISWAVYEVLKALGKHPSYIGTIGIELPGENFTASLTTPPVDQIHHLLDRAKAQNGDYMIMETSSHGLSQGRLAGVHWKVAMFTNLTEDHRDYHHTMEDYFLSKRILFDNWAEDYKVQKDANSAAIINIDDSYGLRLFNELKNEDAKLPLISVGKNGILKIGKTDISWQGYGAELEFAGTRYNLQSKCIGRFNIYNLAMVFVCLMLMGFDSGDILKQLSKFTGAPGRMQMRQKPGGGMILIDYAHTPDALKKAIETARELKPKKLIVVFGCGGDRDQTKRGEMGKIADALADYTIVTNDNPRSEDPEKIVSQIILKMNPGNFNVIYDRRQAIEQAVQNLTAGEVLLIAGKGHEDYQVLATGKIHFSDSEAVEEAIQNNG